MSSGGAVCDSCLGRPARQPELVLASPMTRRAVALQKLAAPLTALTAAMAMVVAGAAMRRRGVIA
jgi:alpha-beta hydrolase superfamily lysophospholipase